MKSIFNKTGSPGINAVTKTVIYWLLFLILLLGSGVISGSLVPAKWQRHVYGILGCLGAFFAVWLMVKSENKSLAAYGLAWQKSTFPKFIKGFFTGTAFFAMIMLLLLGFTQYSLAANPAVWNPWSVVGYLSIIPLALMEEVAFRSYPFIKLNQVFGLRITQVIIAIIFAWYHIIQGWGILIAFLGPGVWSLVFGLSAVWSNGIAVPTGIHVALNLMQQVVGMNNSASDPIWFLSLPERSSAAVIANAETRGIMIQLLVLAAAIIFTAMYIRKIKTTTEKNNSEISSGNTA